MRHTDPTTQKLNGRYPLYFTFSEQTGQQRITEAILWLYKRRLDVVIDDPVVMIDVFRVTQNMHQLFVSNIKVSHPVAMSLTQSILKFAQSICADIIRYTILQYNPMNFIGYMTITYA